MAIVALENYRTHQKSYRYILIYASAFGYAPIRAGHAYEMFSYSLRYKKCLLPPPPLILVLAGSVMVRRHELAVFVTVNVIYADLHLCT